MFLKVNWGWESEFKSDQSFASVLKLQLDLLQGRTVTSQLCFDC